jgi:hypothetical protein
MRGIWVRRGEWVGAVSLARLENTGYQYSASELGAVVQPDPDYLGELEFSGGDLYLGYGLTESLALGFQASSGRATFRTAADDVSPLPAEIRETGLGELRTELTWRFLEERGRRPELFLFAAVAVPHDSDKVLLGTPDWRLLPGIGLFRAFSWGTLAARGALEYDAGSESEADFGEWSLEAQRRTSRAWWVSAGVGGQIGGANNLDEAWLLADLVWRPTPRLAVRFHNRVGVTDQSSGWSPAVGIVVSGRGAN